MEWFVLILQGNCITGQARENETKFPSSIPLGFSFFLSQRKESVHIIANDPQIPAKDFWSRPLWDTIDPSVQASWLWRSTLRKKLLKKRNKRQGGVSQRVHDILISRLQINITDPRWGDILLRVHRSRYYYRIFSGYSCTYQGQSLISDPLSDAMIMHRLEGRLTCAVGLFSALINATIQSRRINSIG